MMGDPGGEREGFTELHSGHRRGDRTEVSPNIHGGIGFRIKRFMLGRTAAQEDNDAGFGPAKTCGLGDWIGSRTAAQQPWQ